MKKRIHQLTESLITIRSVEGNAGALSRVLDLALSYCGDFTIEQFEQNGIRSALVYAGQTRPKKFRVILNAHLDVVDGKDSQFVPMQKGNRLYGAGSMDMKGNAAALIAAFVDHARDLPYPVGLQLTTDEEIGGFDGTKYQLEKGVRADFVLTSEPTNFDIVHQAKGVLRITVRTKGATAHGAYPWRGTNAILVMNEYLQRVVKKFPIPKKEVWKSTINVARIETDNTAHNKIPDSCAAYFDIRFVGNENTKIITALSKMLPKGGVLTVTTNEPAVDTAKTDPFVKALSQSVKAICKRPVRLRGANGTSDARHFARLGTPGVEFGPIGGDIGSDREWVDVKSLDTFYDVISDFLQRIA